MQVIETSSSGLKRELKVVVGAGELGQRFTQRLDEIKDQVQLKGFRKGKVPLSHIKKVFGRSLMAEVLEKTIDETSRQAITDRKERPALQPKIDLPQEKDEVEKVLSGEADLAYSMAFEVLPEISIADLTQIKLERLSAKVDAADIDSAVKSLAERNITFIADEARLAEEKDRVTIDFIGRIDGVPFEGGTGEAVPVVIGQGGFIAGIEEGLKGAKAGEERSIGATFPAEYPVETLKGKTAQFEIKVKEVARPEVPAIDDQLAKSLGAESLEKLREMVAAQIQREYDQVARSKLKRQLLDALDKGHDFPLPATLVDGEFEGIWEQITRQMKEAGKSFPDEEGKSEEQAREEYRKIAERRVRLGLVIGEIGDKNKIQVGQDEVRRSMIERARQFPGQERAVFEYYEKTPGAIAELRAPIFEDKVVDYILAQANPSERAVTREELLKPDADADKPATA